MTNPETRYTRRESLAKAFKDSAKIVLPAMLVMAAFTYFGGITASLHKAGETNPATIEASNQLMYLIVGTMSVFLTLASTLLGYMRYRETPTQNEVREQDRRKFNKLASEYPEFVSAHQHKLESAAESLLDHIETNFPGEELSEPVKALKNALTWG